MHLATRISVRSHIDRGHRPRNKNFPLGSFPPPFIRMTLPMTSVDRDCVTKYMNQFLRLVKNVCSFMMHFKIGKCLNIYSVISCGSPVDGVLGKPGRDTLG